MTFSHILFGGLALLCLAALFYIGYLKFSLHWNMRNGLPIEVRTREGLVFEQSYAWPRQYHIVQCERVNPDPRALQSYGDRPLAWAELWPKLRPDDQKRWAYLNPAVLKHGHPNLTAEPPR